MRDYEITILLKSDLEEKKATSWMKSFEGLLDKSGAKVKGKIANAKRPLAYEIKKMREANYVFAEVEMSPDKIFDMEPILRNDDSVLRYLIVVKK